jgi:HPt (histidine-containing phosphotransfer) domain-containing protein
VPANRPPAEVTPAPSTPRWKPPEYLNNLASINPGLLGDVIEAFLSDTAPRVRRLQSAVDAGDLFRVGREAHAIKGSSSQLSVGRIPLVCMLIELAVAQRNTDELPRLAESLDYCFAEARTCMRQY